MNALAVALADDAMTRAGDVILAEKAGRVTYIGQDGARKIKGFALTDRVYTLAIDLLVGDRDALRARVYTCEHGVLRAMACHNCFPVCDA